jgi:hypothetical protein
MPPNRGARPRGPRPWPQRAEEKRQDMFDGAGEILAKIDRLRDENGQIVADRNIYLTERVLAEISEEARYIQTLALEARLLGQEGGEGADIAALVREEVARQLTKLAEDEGTAESAAPQARVPPIPFRKVE